MALRISIQKTKSPWRKPHRGDFAPGLAREDLLRLRVLPRERAELVLVERLAAVIADCHDLRGLPPVLQGDEPEGDFEYIVVETVLRDDETFRRDDELGVLEAGTPSPTPATEVNAVGGPARPRSDLSRIGLAIEHVQCDLATLTGENEKTLRLERLKTENGTRGHGNDLFRLPDTANDIIIT